MLSSQGSPIPGQLGHSALRGRLRQLAWASVPVWSFGIFASREYDDGGLVDVNHVPGDVLASHLALTAQEVKAVIDARAQLGEFSSADELSAYAELAPAKVDEIRDLMWFG